MKKLQEKNQATYKDVYKQQKIRNKKIRQTLPTSKCDKIYKRCQEKLDKASEAEKLLVYREAWKEVCKVSMFGEQLKDKMEAYEKYLNALLAVQPMEAPKPPSRPTLEGVKELEDQLIKEVDMFNKLKIDLELEEKTTEESLLKLNEEEKKMENCTPEEILEDSIEKLHCELEVNLKELDELRKQQKQDYVVNVVYNRVFLRVKETEVDIQRLKKQNQLLDVSIRELEEQLDVTLVKSGIKEKDAKLLWRRIDTEDVVKMESSK